MSIEVERKFRVREDTEERLRAMGAACRGTSSFRDCYFDTEDHRLTAADHWLRTRDGRWQLKTPAGGSGRVGPPGTTRYRETESEADIVALLLPLLLPERLPLRERGWQEEEEEGEGSGRVEELVGAVPLQVFASILTERKVYEVAAGGLRVDLDRASFGYQVGEIEVMVGGEDEIPAALSRIQELASKLGLEDAERQPGKMHMYLQRYCPFLFQKLLDAHVL
ncbi:thiamine-triphosphatase [Heptranchias perlo]|uniref:thiamine-triphosphatase n=1 Tax=Heptranchias perlo TaxID=212740 RepID=UPI003559EF85